LDSTLISILVLACLVVAIVLGIGLRRILPQHHLTGDSKDAVKLAMGLVATMSALLLGLLVSSAKGTYDTARGQVITMRAKIAFTDRVLEAYGPEADDMRARLRELAQEWTRQLWPEPGMKGAQAGPNIHVADAAYAALHRLAPKDDRQRDLKAEALTLVVQLAEIRTVLRAQAVPSISMPLLMIVVGWLAVIFLSFSLVAPSNSTVTAALLVAALSVTAAIFLMMELDRPFDGLVRIPPDPLVVVQPGK
jgi:hypothetical protein